MPKDQRDRDHQSFQATRRQVIAAAMAAASGMAHPALAATGSKDADAPGNRGLNSIAAARGRGFGAAVEMNLLLRDPQYAALVERDCGLLMPAYEAKWAALQPREGAFETYQLDTFLSWAKQRGKIVRGHALVWHKDLPDWALAALQESPKRARGVMEAHFDYVLAHTRDGIRDWDVVNEPVADPPGSDTPQATGELRETPWLRALGPDYIALAFRLARERDATLRLTLNEYGIEEDTPYCQEKRRRLLNLVRSLRKAGVPVQSVGIQAHLQMVRSFSVPVFTRFCRALRAEGVDLIVTEMDVREHWKVPEGYVARDQVVAERVGRFMEAALEGGIRNFMTWGLVDRYSWLVNDPGVARTDGLQHRGLPLDWEGNQKQYWRVMAEAFRRSPSRS